MTGAVRAAVRPGGRLAAVPWARLGVLALVVALTFVVARSCQQSQVRISKEQAIATAERAVRFEPTHTQIRLLRQGVGAQPFWIVSLSIPRDEQRSRFSELAVVRVDANTGKVADVRGPSAPAER